MKCLYSLPLPSVLVALTLCPAFASAQLAATAVSVPSPASYYAAVSHPYSSSSSAAEFALAAPASAAASASAAPAAPAASGGSPFSALGVGVKLGVAGIGFDVATPLVYSRLNLRGGATFFSYNINQTTNDGLVENGTLTLQNSGVMLDWFPFRGSFRLSGGATVYNNKNVNASISEPANKSFTLGNDTYYSSSTNPLTGTGTFKLGGNAGGRVSFGWGNLVPKPGHHFSFDTELGIEFVSKPTVALGFTGSVCTTTPCTVGTPVSNYGNFQNDVAAEQVKLQNDVNFLSFYPIISVGIGYKIGH